MDLIKYYPHSSFLFGEDNCQIISYNEFEYDKYDSMIFSQVINSQKITSINDKLHSRFVFSNRKRSNHTILTIEWVRGQIVYMDKIFNEKLVASIRTERPGTGVYKFNGYLTKNKLRYQLGDYRFPTHRTRGANFEINYRDNEINMIKIDDSIVFNGEFHPDYKDLIESTKVDFKLNGDLIVEIN